MADGFKAAKLKVKRANKHISDLQDAIRALKETYTVAVEQNAETGYQNLIHTLNFDDAVADDLALIVGDALHNLKSALDFAWIGLLRKYISSADLTKAKFPVYPTRESLIGALNGIRINPTSNAAIFNLLVTDIEPYEGGRYGGIVYILHELDITDKHLILLGTHPVAELEGIVVQHEHGEVIHGFGASTDAHPPYVIPLPADAKIKNQGKLAFDVVLEDTGFFYLVEIVEVLSKFSQVIAHFVELMENV